VSGRVLLSLRACVSRALAAQGRTPIPEELSSACDLYTALTSGADTVVLVGGGIAGSGSGVDALSWRALCLAVSPVLVAHMLSSGDDGVAQDAGFSGPTLGGDGGDRGVGRIVGNILPGIVAEPAPAPAGPISSTLDFMPAVVIARHVLPEVSPGAAFTWCVWPSVGAGW
jgi:hypothetical protein